MNILIDNIEALISEVDKYLQINDIAEADLRRIWERLQAEYAGYDKWFCFRNVEIPYDLLNELGAVIEEDCKQMKLFPDTFTGAEVQDVLQISDETFAEFAAFHDERNPDMYWTGERLARDYSKWGIFFKRTNEKISDYVIMSMRHSQEAEIFCIETPNVKTCRELFSFAAKYAFDNGKTYVLYMSDEEMRHEAALTMGFAVTGFYKGFSIK